MSKGVSKVLLKLQSCIQEGNFYEAHQMYHSISQRLLKQKKGPEALDLIQQGAKEMAAHGQLSSALDLTSRLLDAFDTLSMSLNDEIRGFLFVVFSRETGYTRTDTLK